MLADRTVSGIEADPDRALELLDLGFHGVAARRQVDAHDGDVGDEARMIRGMMRPHRTWIADNEARNQQRWRWRAFAILLAWFLAQNLGVTDDPVLRQRLADVWMRERIIKFIQIRYFS